MLARCSTVVPYLAIWIAQSHHLCVLLVRALLFLQWQVKGVCCFLKKKKKGLLVAHSWNCSHFFTHGQILIYLFWASIIPVMITLCSLRSCPQSSGQQAQARGASRFRAGVYAGGHSQQGPVLFWYRAADAQRHRPGGRGRHQTAPPVGQAEAQVPGEEEHHHHLRHRQSKDKLQGRRNHLAFNTSLLQFQSFITQGFKWPVSIQHPFKVCAFPNLLIMKEERNGSKMKQSVPKVWSRKRLPRDWNWAY